MHSRACFAYRVDHWLVNSNPINEIEGSVTVKPTQIVVCACIADIQFVPHTPALAHAMPQVARVKEANRKRKMNRRTIYFTRMA